MAVIAQTGDLLFDDLANLLQDSGLRTIGRDLFLHYAPAQVQECSFFVNNLKGSKVDPYLPGWRRHHFRIVERGLEYQSILTKLHQVLPLLEVQEVDLDHVYIRLAYAEGDPICFPRSYNSEIVEASVVINAVYFFKPSDEDE